MLKFKNDKFKKSRGGYSRWLIISCENCKKPLLIYQKDGPGILKRLYLDRIPGQNIEPFRNLICKKCKVVIGMPMIYKKEHRQAYRLFAGSVEKKIVSENEVKKFLRDS